MDGWQPQNEGYMNPTPEQLLQFTRVVALQAASA